MSFTEDWFPLSDAQALSDIYAMIDGAEGAVVEIGCWEGRSTCVLAQACYPAVVHAVDTWKGTPGEPCLEWAKKRDVFAIFQANVAAQTKGNVKPHQMGWRQFFAKWRHPISFIHIDAQHTYEEVRDNINAALPLIVPGGVICGHDAPCEPVYRAATDTLGAVGITSALWFQKQEGETGC